MTKEVFVIYASTANEEARKSLTGEPLQVTTTEAAAKGWIYDNADEYPQSVQLRFKPFAIGGTGKPRAKKGDNVVTMNQAGS